MAIRSTHEDGKTEACLHRILNKSCQRIKAVWVGFDTKEVCYMDIEPGHARPQQTFTTHVWRVRFADTNALVGEYAGPSAQLIVQPDGNLSVQSWSEAMPQPKPEWGTYARRGEALGIEIWAYACVDPRAVRIAEHIVKRMLEASPDDVVQRLVAGSSKVAVIGRNQVTTDIPAHTFMRWAEGGRDTDSTTRGLGGTEESPTTSCGEENLLMEDDRFYPCENILVHEFGHAVMNIGLTRQDRTIIKELYQKAYRSGLYDEGAYIMENEEEYWAEGTQAWFNATIRTDVTSGVMTREEVRSRDPGLAGMMERAYGDGSWRYPQDSPASFRTRKHPEIEPQQEVLASASSEGAEAGTVSGSARPADFRPPGVEFGMERSRPIASWGSSGAAWLTPALQSCLPGSLGSCGMAAAGSWRNGGGSGVGGGAKLLGLSTNPGCGTAVWMAVREAVLGHPPHATVKMS